MKRDWIASGLFGAGIVGFGLFCALPRYPAQKAEPQKSQVVSQAGTVCNGVVTAANSSTLTIPDDAQQMSKTIDNIGMRVTEIQVRLEVKEMEVRQLRSQLDAAQKNNARCIDEATKWRELALRGDRP